MDCVSLCVQGSYTPPVKVVRVVLFMCGSLGLAQELPVLGCVLYSETQGLPVRQGERAVANWWSFLVEVDPFSGL